MPHNRIALSFAALLLCGSALTAPAQAGWFDFGSSDKPAAKEDKKPAATVVAPAQDLDGAIHQAQLMRISARYDEAIKQLSQIMLVAADDPRVVSEYGKTLAAMGRASDAVNFLSRAQQLSPNDWSVYSALGVAYDQTDDHVKAAASYERALALKPGEPSVLNNYALSRMLAKDPDGAKKLIARSESAGGGSDPKIAHNIAMINKLAPLDDAVAANTPAPRAVALQAPPVAAPRVAVASQPIAQAAYRPQPVQQAVSIPLPPVSSAPRPLVASNGVIPAQQQAMTQMPNGVVMQRVPVDPLAGPVLPRHVAAAIPKPPRASSASAPKMAAAPQAAQASDLEAKAEAIAKQLSNKPERAQAMADANKSPVPKALPPKASDAKPAVKAADAKPVKVADASAAKAKTADAKAVPAKATPKDAVPALRVSASAY